MSQVVRPERTSQKVARSLLELAAVLADDDTDSAERADSSLRSR